MKIISKFSDYYDSGLAYGIDKELYFERKITHLGSPFGNGGTVYNSKYIAKDKIFKTGYVKFCDKYYPFVAKRKRIGKKGVRENEVNDKTYKTYYYYDIETLFDENPELLEEDNRTLNEYNYYGLSNREKFEKIFEKKDKHVMEDKYPELKDTPYYIYRTWGCDYSKVNEGDFDYYTTLDNLGILKKVGFHKAVDPYTAFQELSMFIGAKKSASENKGCEISDDVRMAGHGMDKTSFRKGKEKK